MPPKKEEKKKEEKKEEKKAAKGGKAPKGGDAPKVAKVKKELTEEQLAALKPSARRAARKKRFRTKLENLVQEFKNILIVKVDNVGSNQMQKIRIALRGKAVMLMGKNTMMRRVIRDAIPSNPRLESLLTHVYGNIGFVFTNGDLQEVRKIISENKVPAAAKAGTIAPTDVYVPPGPTGLDPGQTAFFQALNIGTKIAKGSIEIINETHLIKKGDKVNSSSVALLTKLNIKPFFYGIVVNTVYEDGSVYDAAILDISHDDLLNKFFSGVRLIAALGLQIGYTSIATIPHSFAAGFKFMVATSLATDYTFDESKSFKEYLANPDAFKATSTGSDAPKAEAAKEAAKEEEEEEEGDMGFSLFD